MNEELIINSGGQRKKNKNQRSKRNEVDPGKISRISQFIPNPKLNKINHLTGFGTTFNYIFINFSFLLF